MNLFIDDEKHVGRRVCCECGIFESVRNYIEYLKYLNLQKYEVKKG